MRTLPATVLPFFCSFSLLGAQDGGPAHGCEVDSGAVIRNAFGVAVHEGAVRGLGPDYSARFAGDGVTFTPLLAAAPAVRTELHWRTDDVRRGDREVWTRSGDTAPAVQDCAVRYRLAAGIDEVYDVRRCGIEQSFVFATKPAGRGDLVVRCSMTTELPHAADGDGGVLYAHPGADGVRFGAVTGIDAHGNAARGGVRVIGTTLELSLPDAFVESAHYPLVLDPLVGAAFTLASSANLSVTSPSVAFDDSADRYLVVWSVLTTVTELRAQLVDNTGAPIGSALLLAASSSTPPFFSHGVSIQGRAVANVNSVNRFLVAWRETDATFAATTYSLELVAVNASNGAVSSPVNLYTSSGFPPAAVSSYAVAGNRLATGTNSDVAWVVFEAVGIEAVRVQVPSTGPPTVVSTTSLGSGRDVNITQDGGTLPRWLTCWVATVPPSTQPTEVHAQPLGGSGPCGAPLTLFTAAVGDTVAATTCATQSGASTLVAWTNTAAGADDLQVTNLSFGGICSGLTSSQGAVLTLPTAAGLQDQPALAYASGKYVLAWRHRTTASSTARVHVMGLHATTGAPAGADLQIDGNTVLGQEAPSIASRWSGGDTASDEALVVWTSGSLRARRFETFGGGAVTSLGGACGTTGLNDFATYNGLPTLGTTFSIELAAPTAPVLALIVGFSQNPVACGPCTIVPSPDILMGGGGPVPVNVPLDPNLIGFSLYTQWLQWRPSGCGLLPDFGFSNTLRFTIAE